MKQTDLLSPMLKVLFGENFQNITKYIFFVCVKAKLVLLKLLVVEKTVDNRV